MCGVFGVVGIRYTNSFNCAAHTLDHRGPDAFGEWIAPDEMTYLAHCRLAIIDLSPAGTQPFSNEDGSVQVVFNGEIYNFQELRRELLSAGHRFKSQSDTEVIVHGYEEWGSAVVDRLRGIFSFGIWDNTKRRLLLARDRLGVKPLYFSVSGRSLAFASEPRAILALPGVARKPNPQALVQFLQYGFISRGLSAWEGIHKLLPGNLLTFEPDNGVIRTECYWVEPEGVLSNTWDQSVEQLDQLLSQAVQEELISDVPVGVFLSGGIDSSLVSAYAAKVNPSIKSFCVDFLGWAGSEVNDSRTVASYLGTSHFTLPLQSNSCRLTNPEFSEPFFRTWDEPLGDPAIIPTWHLSRLIRKHVTVALSGDGGDELFSGYRWYQQVVPTMRRQVAWKLEKLRRKFGRGREFPNGCVDEHEYYHFLHSPSFANSELKLLFPEWQHLIDHSIPGNLTRSLMGKRYPSQREWQRCDLHSYLVDNNLARVDRASMAHGLEVRVPLLDHRVAEFAFTSPIEFSSIAGVSKVLLRELAKRYLPGSIQQKPKQGFSFPLESFVSRYEMADTIATGCLIESGLISAQSFAVWRNQQNAPNLMLKLWLLFILEQWAKNWWKP
jgi:asparagine synthase (glutamine-hydrolysing)